MRGTVSAALLLAGLLAACDTAAPPYAPRLVVEGVVEASEASPVVTLRRTLPSGAALSDDTADGALATLVVDGVPLVLAGLGDGRYRALLPAPLSPGQRLSFSASWGGAPEVSATTEAVEPFTLDSVRVEHPAAPVRAALLDALGFDPDLVADVVRREGYVYPVTVTAHWHAPALPVAAAPTWIRLNLAPDAPAAVRFFFPPEAVVREAEPGDAAGRRTLRVTYAIEAADATAPIARHRLRVAAVRGGEAYARFIESRSTPGRREPVTNVAGGRGLFAAVSTDSMRLTVQ